MNGNTMPEPEAAPALDSERATPAAAPRSRIDIAICGALIAHFRSTCARSRETSGPRSGRTSTHPPSGTAARRGRDEATRSLREHRIRSAMLEREPPQGSLFPGTREELAGPAWLAHANEADALRPSDALQPNDVHPCRGDGAALV